MCERMTQPLLLRPPTCQRASEAGCGWVRKPRVQEALPQECLPEQRLAVEAGLPAAERGVNQRAVSLGGEPGG